MPNAQNGFVIKQTVDRITICDKYMQIKFKCGVTFDRKYVKKKRMNSASKCLIQHFEALIAIFISDISSESGGNNHNDMLQFR